MKKQTLKKSAVIFSLAVIALALLCVLLIAVAFAYAHKTVDYEADELLFRSASEGNVIRQCDKCAFLTRSSFLQVLMYG